jgi:hypothetical protein
MALSCGTLFYLSLTEPQGFVKHDPGKQWPTETYIFTKKTTTIRKEVKLVNNIQLICYFSWTWAWQSSIRKYIFFEDVCSQPNALI